MLLLLLYCDGNRSLRARGAMDVLTFHTLMMGHAKLGRHPRVLELYAEAVQTNISVHL